MKRLIVPIVSIAVVVVLCATLVFNSVTPEEVSGTWKTLHRQNGNLYTSVIYLNSDGMIEMTEYNESEFVVSSKTASYVIENRRIVTNTGEKISKLFSFLVFDGSVYIKAD